MRLRALRRRTASRAYSQRAERAAWTWMSVQAFRVATTPHAVTPPTPLRCRRMRIAASAPAATRMAGVRTASSRRWQHTAESTTAIAAAHTAATATWTWTSVAASRAKTARRAPTPQCAGPRSASTRTSVRASPGTRTANEAQTVTWTWTSARARRVSTAPRARKAWTAGRARAAVGGTVATALSK